MPLADFNPNQLERKTGTRQPVLCLCECCVFVWVLIGHCGLLVLLCAVVCVFHSLRNMSSALLQSEHEDRAAAALHPSGSQIQQLLVPSTTNNQESQIQTNSQRKPMFLDLYTHVQK